MRTVWCLTAALTLTAGAAARADEKAETRAVLDKAIKATGGLEKLDAAKATTFNAKGKFYGMGDGIDYTSEWAVRPPDKIRFQMEFEVNAMKITFLLVFDGKKGWMKVNGNTTDLDEDALAEAREDMYAEGVVALAPLVKDKGYELSPLGEVKVEGRDAVGVRVSHKGHRDVNLFFDKKTGLLAKSERTVKDQMAGGKERTQETLYGDYKEVGGVRHPMKFVNKRDGEKHLEAELSDYETKDTLDDSLFAKP